MRIEVQSAMQLTNGKFELLESVIFYFCIGHAAVVFGLRVKWLVNTYAWNSISQKSIRVPLRHSLWLRQPSGDAVDDCGS